MLVNLSQNMHCIIFTVLWKTLSSKLNTSTGGAEHNCNQQPVAQLSCEDTFWEPAHVSIIRMKWQIYHLYLR